MRWDKDTPITSPQEPIPSIQLRTSVTIPSHTTPRGFNKSEQTSLSEAGENMDPKASPTEDTRHTVATGSPPPGEGEENHHHPPHPTSDRPPSTSYRGALLHDTAVLFAQPSTDTHPPDVHSPRTGARKETRCTSPGAECLSLADRRRSSIVNDKALNIFWVTGVSECGPVSNDTQLEDYYDHQDGIPNLGNPYRYGIALLDPYMRVVPPPPIVIKPPD